MAKSGYGTLDIDSEVGGRVGIAASPSSEGEDVRAALSKPIARVVLLHLMRTRAYRVKQCRSAPVSVLFYILYAVAILLHARVEDSFDVEKRCDSDNAARMLIDTSSMSSPLDCDVVSWPTEHTFVLQPLGNDRECRRWVCARQLWRLV
jgi:hypothetical protein